MHIGIFLKHIVPLSIYLSGMVAALAAMVGHYRQALILVTVLLPLRNVIERVQAFPLGNQFLDVLLIGILIGSVFHKNSLEEKTPYNTGIKTIALVTVIYVLCSLIWGGIYLHGGFSFNIHDDRIQDWKNFSLLPLLFYLNFRANSTKKEVWTIFSVICFALFIVDYYTAMQIREHPSLISRAKISGTFQFLGPNEVAAFLNEYTIILMSVLYAMKKDFKKLAVFVIVLADLFCITFVYSRGAYIALTIGMLILFFFKDKKLLAILIVCLCLWKVVLPQKVIERINQTETSSGELDPSAEGRLMMWRHGIELFKSSPIFGIGFGSFRRMGFELRDTHNIYVKILTEQGIIGISIFFVTLFLFMKEGWRLFQKGDEEYSKALGLGFVCCVFVMMVNNFFGDRWSYLEPNAYLWIFAGLVARLNVISQDPQQQPKAVEEKPSALLTATEKPKKRLKYYDRRQ